MLGASATLGLLPNLGLPELLILGVIMLLLFGRRLPEVGKSLGQGIVQFKKGLSDIEDEVNKAGTSQSRQPPAQFESARAPVNASGDDVRVSRAESAESPVGQAKPAES